MDPDKRAGIALAINPERAMEKLSVVVSRLLSEDPLEAQAARSDLFLLCNRNLNNVLTQLAEITTEEQIQKLTEKAHTSLENQSENYSPDLRNFIKSELATGLTHITDSNPNYRAARHAQLRKILQALGLVPYPKQLIELVSKKEALDKTLPRV